MTHLLLPCILGVLLLVQSVLVWSIVNRILPIEQRVSFGRTLLVLLVAQGIQYLIGHSHLLDSVGNWIYVEQFVLNFLAVLVGFRISVLRSLGVAVICIAVTTAVLLLYGWVLGFI